MRRVGRRIRSSLPLFVAAGLLWLLMANIMGASASYFDSEQTAARFSAFTSSRWMQTNRTDFILDTRVSTDIDRQPGSVVLSGRTEFIYGFRGASTRTFWRYNTTTATWSALANAPSALRDEGGALACDGNRYIYAIHGGNREFWRYDITTNSWTSLANTPRNVRLGGGLGFDGKNSLYALQGDSANGFWRYNITANSWTVLPTTPSPVGDGGCLICDQKGFVYVVQGDGLRAFWGYNVTSNAWSALTQVPYPVDYGGAISYDGIYNIYLVVGGSTAYFLRYNTSQNAWSVLQSVPRAVSYGGSLAFYYPGALYAFSGGGTTRYYRYDLTSGTWSAATSAPGNVNRGGALASGPLLLSRSGTITSITFDTKKSGCKVQGLFWNEVLASGTDITFEMRASDTLASGAPSGPWISLGGTSPVTSGFPSGRYIQWRATLITGNNHLSPVLQEVRVYYA